MNKKQFKHYLHDKVIFAEELIKENPEMTMEQAQRIAFNLIMNEQLRDSKEGK